MLEEVEQKGGCIYGVKGRSIEGKQIGWLPTANLSQHRLKSEKKKKTPTHWQRIQPSSKKRGH